MLTNPLQNFLYNSSTEHPLEQNGCITFYQLTHLPLFCEEKDCGFTIMDTIFAYFFNLRGLQYDFFKKECLLYLRRVIGKIYVNVEFDSKLQEEKFISCSFYVYENDKEKTTFYIHKDTVDDLNKVIKASQDVLYAMNEVERLRFEMAKAIDSII